MPNTSKPGKTLSPMDRVAASMMREQTRQMYEQAWRLLVEEAQDLTMGQVLLVVTREGRRIAMEHQQELSINSGKTERRKWVREHRDWLRANYSLLRVAWLYRWRFLLAEAGDAPPPAFLEYPWYEWYFAILGETPDDCAESDWPVVLHQWFQDLLREKRREFERTHYAKDNCWQSGVESWRDWYYGTALLGLEAVQLAWTDEAAYPDDDEDDADPDLDNFAAYMGKVGMPKEVARQLWDSGAVS